MVDSQFRAVKTVRSLAGMVDSPGRKDKRVG